jgi:hypothetical protein
MEPGTDATGDLSFFTSFSGAATSVTTQRRTGARSIKQDTGAGPTAVSLRVTNVMADAGRRVSFYLRTDALPATQGVIAMVITAGAVSIFELDHTTTGALSLYATGVGGSGAFGPANISIGKWDRISVAYTITSATVWTINVYLNGALVKSWVNAGTLTNTGSNGIDWYLYEVPVGVNYVRYLDDLFIDDLTDLADTGDIHVTNKRPNANGGANTFDTTTGSSSGYGAGNSVYVNAIPLSTSNARSFAAAGGSVNENFAIEDDITGEECTRWKRVIARGAWAHGSGVSTDTLWDNGTAYVPGTVFDGTAGIRARFSDTTQFPTSASCVGMGRPTGNATDAVLNECGMLIAFRGGAVWMESGTDATGDQGFWQAGGGLISDTAEKFTGPRSILLDLSNPAVAKYCFQVYLMSPSGRRFTFRFKASGVPADWDTLWLMRDRTGTYTALSIAMSPTGQIGIYDGTDAYMSTETSVGVGRWDRIAFAYDIISTTNWRAKLYLNGKLVASADSGNTLAGMAVDSFQFYAHDASGVNFKHWYDDVYIDDGCNLGDPGDIRVTAKRPNAENVNGFDAAVGAARGASDWDSVDEVPRSDTNGWRHRGGAFVAAGALATNATTTTLTITAPACSVDDILLAFIHGNNNQTVSPPDGTWTSVVEVNNTTAMRSSVFWKRATASGGTHAFTKPTDDNLLFAGLICAWKGCPTNATPIDATTPTTSANASSDDVTYATFDPVETNGLVIAAGFYNQGGTTDTTAGAMSGTNPTFAVRADVETSVGANCSIFVYDGLSTGAATGARTHPTTSATNAINTGILIGLVLQGQENYGLEARTVGDVNITRKRVIARLPWVFGKVSATAASQTAAIVDDGLLHPVVFGTGSDFRATIVHSSSYPSNVAGIGLRSSGTVEDTYLYECGTLIAYTPPGQVFPVRRPQFFRRKKGF